MTGAAPTVNFEPLPDGHDARRIAEGAIDYARTHTQWKLATGQADADASLKIVSQPSLGCVAKVRRSGKSVEVRSDPVAVAKLAVDHFVERGFERLAVFPDSNESLKAFRAAAGPVTLHVLDETTALIDLPRRIGLIAPDRSAALFARQLLAANIRIPDDVAVLAVGDDPLICELSPVALSSIDLDGHAIGYRAAEQLDRLLQKRAAKKLLIPPRGITVRASTDVLAIDDPEVAAAVRFIRTNAHRPLAIADILRTVPLHRRALERKFRKHLAQSPAEVLRRARIEIAKTQLARTDQPLAGIAKSAGFALPQHLTTAFKQVTGLTPSAYRQQFRRI